MNYIKIDDFITVESESDPGVLKKFLVSDIMPNGAVKLVYQDERVLSFGKRQLKEYMEDYGVSTSMLADALGVSRSTVYRYISGSRRIPAKVFNALGIRPPETYLQKEKAIEELLVSLAVVRDKIDNIINKEGK